MIYPRDIPSILMLKCWQSIKIVGNPFIGNYYNPLHSRCPMKKHPGEFTSDVDDILHVYIDPIDIWIYHYIDDSHDRFFPIDI